MSSTYSRISGNSQCFRRPAAFFACAIAHKSRAISALLARQATLQVDRGYLARRLKITRGLQYHRHQADDSYILQFQPASSSQAVRIDIIAIIAVVSRQAKFKRHRCRPADFLDWYRFMACISSRVLKMMLRRWRFPSTFISVSSQLILFFYIRGDKDDISSWRLRAEI